MLPLTSVPGVHRKEDAKPGMAFFSGTGPDGTTCGKCKFRGLMRTKRDEKFDEKTNEFVTQTYRYLGCWQFHSMTGLYGPAVGSDYPSCKYFEAKTK